MSKYKGVTFCADRTDGKRWKAEIVMPNKVHKLIGYFNDERSAGLAYDIYAVKYGRPTNILKKC